MLGQRYRFKSRDDSQDQVGAEIAIERLKKRVGDQARRLEPRLRRQAGRSRDEEQRAGSRRVPKGPSLKAQSR